MWLSIEFAQNSAHVLQWLAVGVLINSLAFVPFGFIQAAGRPDLTAKLHLLEMLPYLGLLWFGMEQLGLQGVAIVWTIRVAFDALAMFFIASTLEVQLKWRFKYVTWLFVALSALLFGSLEESFHVRLTYAITVALLFSLAAWHWLLLTNERDFIKKRLTGFFQCLFNRMTEVD